MRVGVGVGAGSALVPPLGLGSGPSLLAPCSRTPTTLTPIITRTAPTVTTRPPRHTIRRHRIIRQRGAVGTPITETTTLAEYAGAHLRQIGPAPQVQAPETGRNPRKFHRGINLVGRSETPIGPVESWPMRGVAGKGAWGARQGLLMRERWGRL